MEAFGAALRHLRNRDGLRQVDLAALLGVARSTLANIERGAERPTPRVWEAIELHLPAWARELEARFSAARAKPQADSGGLERDGDDSSDEPFRGGPFEMLSITYSYIFEEARSPAEIIEIRRVRALQAGADRFGLRIAHSEDAGFQIDQQALWGGGIRTSQHWLENGRSVHWAQFDFGRRLRRGEQHEFAIRTFIERDPDPPTDISFNLTVPARQVAIHLAFHGTVRPARAWRFGPLPEDHLYPADGDDGTQPIRLGTNDEVTALFRAPQVGPHYGVGWTWAS